MNLHLSKPKEITWIAALILAVLALLGKLGTIAALAQYDFWLALIAAALLLLATYVKGL
jgi:L-asparagine transporter-like permease